MEFQLRRYTVHEGALEQFVDEWSRLVRPLRERFGFTVVGAWTAAEENQFVWILAYDGQEGYEQRDREYYASPERTALAPDPARHIAKMDTLMMRSALG